MKKLNKDAKDFVEGIVDHLKKDSTGNRPMPKVQSLLRKVSEDAWQENTARVTTAVTLTQSEKEELIRGLSKRMGHPIALECEVKPSIIGGMRIEIADYIIDLSYEETLKSIGASLLKGSHV